MDIVEEYVVYKRVKNNLQPIYSHTQMSEKIFQ